ncbi:hypothetical protein LBMAG42_08490 [Deltaproteobacteria bacterium]|nr:hypothetical protein LBMAG42_08490 [Deltaproteobacteria bacterium]
METPIDATAEVVLQVNPGDWADLPVGTAALGHGEGGTVALTYVGLTKLRLGCDGGAEGDWARFDAPAPLPEGPVLIEDTMAGQYEPQTVLPGTTALGRSWSLGALGSFAVTTPEPNVARATITPTPGGVVTQDFRKAIMEGYDGTAAFNLADPSEIFVPTPLVALRAADGTGRVIASWASFEGVHYDVYALGAESIREGETYVYWCAF